MKSNVGVNKVWRKNQVISHPVFTNEQACRVQLGRKMVKLYSAIPHDSPLTSSTQANSGAGAISIRLSNIHNLPRSSLRWLHTIVNLGCFDSVVRRLWLGCVVCETPPNSASWVLLQAVQVYQPSWPTLLQLGDLGGLTKFQRWSRNHHSCRQNLLSTICTFQEI